MKKEEREIRKERESESNTQIERLREQYVEREIVRTIRRERERVREQTFIGPLVMGERNMEKLKTVREKERERDVEGS